VKHLVKVGYNIAAINNISTIQKSRTCQTDIVNPGKSMHFVSKGGILLRCRRKDTPIILVFSTVEL
jgi:hypothetical protein